MGARTAGLFLVATALVATACSSTSQEHHGGAGSNQDLGLAPIDGVAPAAGASPTTGAARERVDGTKPSTLHVDSEGAASTSDLPASQLPPGVSATTIKLGAPDYRGLNALSALTGQPDPQHFREYAEALVADLNDRGGVWERQVDIVWAPVDVSDDLIDGEEQQQVCATFTEDDPVFAVFWPGDVFVNTSTLYPCLSAAGTGIIDLGALSAYHPPVHDDLKTLVLSGSPGFISAGRAHAEALARQPDAASSRLGVIVYDDARYLRTYEQGFLPALQRAGLAVAELSVLTAPDSSENLVAMQRDARNAAVQFEREGIDVVVSLAEENATIFFMQNAELNGYRPWYRLWSLDLQGTRVEDEAPHEQLRRARATGWVPDHDLDATEVDDGRPPRARCFDFFRERGLTAEGLEREIALFSCEAVWFAEAAFARAPQPPTVDAFIEGVEALGQTHSSVLVGPTRFGVDDHSGAAAYRELAFDVGCGCFRYQPGRWEFPT